MGVERRSVKATTVADGQRKPGIGDVGTSDAVLDSPDLTKEVNELPDPRWAPLALSTQVSSGELRV